MQNLWFYTAVNYNFIPSLSEQSSPSYKIILKNAIEKLTRESGFTFVLSEYLESNIAIFEKTKLFM